MQKENTKKSAQMSDLQYPQSLFQKNYGTNRCPQFQMFREYRQGIMQLNKIFEAKQNESSQYPDDLPISFDGAVKELSLYISECLTDVPEQKRDVARIRAFLYDYKVLSLVPGQVPILSLDRLFGILEDNFEGSFLHKLMKLLVYGNSKMDTKVITFF